MSDLRIAKRGPANGKPHYYEVVGDLDSCGHRHDWRKQAEQCKRALESDHAPTTPGPWTYQPTAGNHDFIVYSEGAPSRSDVALVRDFHEANARLIAAAPDLLDALTRLLGCSALNEDANDAYTIRAINAANDAVAKATARPVTG